MSKSRWFARLQRNECDYQRSREIGSRGLNLIRPEQKEEGQEERLGERMKKRNNKPKRRQRNRIAEWSQASEGVINCFSVCLEYAQSMKSGERWTWTARRFAGQTDSLQLPSSIVTPFHSIPLLILAHPTVHALFPLASRPIPSPLTLLLFLFSYFLFSLDVWRSYFGFPCLSAGFSFSN